MEEFFTEGAILCSAIAAAKAIDLYGENYLEDVKCKKTKEKLSERQPNREMAEDTVAYLEEEKSSISHYWINKGRKKGQIEGELKAYREYLEEYED